MAVPSVHCEEPSGRGARIVLEDFLVKGNQGDTFRQEALPIEEETVPRLYARSSGEGEAASLHPLEVTTSRRNRVQDGLWEHGSGPLR